MQGAPGGPVSGAGGSPVGAGAPVVSTPSPQGAGSFLSKLFPSLTGAMQDPDSMARLMAQNGITPEQFKRDAARESKLAATMRVRQEYAGGGRAAPTLTELLMGRQGTASQVGPEGTVGATMGQRVQPTRPQVAPPQQTLGQLIGGEPVAPQPNAPGQVPINPPVAPMANQVPTVLGGMPSNAPSIGPETRPQEAAYQPNVSSVQPTQGTYTPQQIQQLYDRLAPIVQDSQKLSQLVRSITGQSGMGPEGTVTGTTFPEAGIAGGTSPEGMERPLMGADATLSPEATQQRAPQVGAEGTIHGRHMSQAPYVPEEVATKSRIPPQQIGLETYIPSSTIGAQPKTPESLTKNSMYKEFMDSVKTGVTNPYALAAIAATGQRESGWNPNNVFGSWDDQGASAGGVMSWRAERLQAMRNFVGKNGGDPARPSAALQAKFLLAENPDLIAKLNAAGSPEEAIQLMNNAWAFEGYDQPGNAERNARINLAINLAKDFASGKDAVLPNGDVPIPQDRPGSTDVTTTTSTEKPTTPQEKASGLLASLSEAMKDYDPSKDQIPPPAAVSPRPGEYQPDANMLKLMLFMLGGGGGGGGIPTISQLMSGGGGNG